MNRHFISILLTNLLNKLYIFYKVYIKHIFSLMRAFEQIDYILVRTYVSNVIVS